MLLKTMQQLCCADDAIERWLFENGCCNRVQVKIMCVWSPVVIFQSVHKNRKRLAKTAHKNRRKMNWEWIIKCNEWFTFNMIAYYLHIRCTRVLCTCNMKVERIDTKKTIYAKAVNSIFTSLIAIHSNF